MNLSFSTKWPPEMGDLAGQPNYFISKIWAGAIENRILSPEDMYKYIKLYKEKFGEIWDHKDRGDAYGPKLHTIREDENNRWCPGMKIHPVINNRSRFRFQFAPVLECTGVQLIRICHRFVPYPPAVYVGGYLLDRMDDEQVRQLALNDGFPSVEAFFLWFNKDFEGKIIHWTNLKY